MLNELIMQGYEKSKSTLKRPRSVYKTSPGFRSALGSRPYTNQSKRTWGNKGDLNKSHSRPRYEELTGKNFFNSRDSTYMTPLEEADVKLEREKSRLNKWLKIRDNVKEQVKDRVIDLAR